MKFSTQLLLSLSCLLSAIVTGQTGIANYQFSKVINTTYTPLTNDVVVFSGNYSNSFSNAIPLGGSFTYGGVNFTNCYISTNGYITFGSALGTGTYTPLSSDVPAISGAVAAFARIGGGSTVAGASPAISCVKAGNEFVVQYKDHADYYNRSSDRINFQIRLNLATNAIRIVYGTCTLNGPVYVYDMPEVGIRGNTTNWADNVNNLYLPDVPTGTTCNWKDAVTGYANNTTIVYSKSVNPAINIPYGLSYTWVPAAAPAPVRSFYAPSVITGSSATLKWKPAAGASRYNLQYRLLGVSNCDWTNFSGNPVADTGAVLTDLVPSSIYQIRVQSINDTGAAIWSHIPSNGSAIGPNGYTIYGTFRTDIACPVPTAVNVSSVTHTAATISFSSYGDSFLVEYGPAGFKPGTGNAPGTGGTVVTGSSSPITLSNLTNSTAYDAYVRQNCTTTNNGFSANTAKVSFNTICPDGTVPYLQDFENVTPPAIPLCVVVEGPNGSGKWATRAYRTATSTTNMECRSGDADDWFFIKGLTLTAGTAYNLRFKYWSGDTRYVERMEARVGIAATAAAAKAGVQLYNNANITNINPATGEALFIPTVTGVYYFGFHAYSNYNSYQLNVDDVSVTEAPACPAPTTIKVREVSAATAIVGYTATGADILIEYGPPGFAPGTGATAGTGGTVVTGGSTPVIIGGLGSGSTYDLYIRQNCSTSGNGYSANSAKTTFATLCDAIAPPYTQNFDSVTAPALPTCITVEDANEINTWRTNVSTLTGSSRPNVMLYSANYSTPADDWFFLRGVVLTAGVPYNISYRYGGFNTYGTTEKMEIRVGNAPTAAAALSGPRIFNDDSIITWKTSGADFTPAITGTYYFGFHTYSAANQAQLFVDNIYLKKVCVVPDIPVVDSITATSVVVRLNSPGNQYTLEYGPAGFTPGNGSTSTGNGTVVQVTGSMVKLTGLSSGTTYDVYVRQNCFAIGSGSSPNSTKAIFTTVCTPGTLPYSENFNAVVAPAIPPCITVENTNGGNTWETAPMPASYFSSPNSMKYTYSSTAPADDWFFTKPVLLNAGSIYKLSFGISGTGLEVRVSNTPTAQAALPGPRIFWYENATLLAGGGTGYFTPDSTGYYYMGFHAYAAANQSTLYVDDINLKLETSCAAPLYAGIDSITSNSVRVKFPYYGNPVIIEYGRSGFTPGTGATAGTGGTVVNATSSPITITGLLPGTRYHAYIRQNCSTQASGYSNNQPLDSFVTAFTAVTNDLPKDAILLTVGSGCSGGAYSNSAATKAAGEPGASCAGPQTAGKSVWFKFTAPAGGFVRVSTDSDSTTFFDTKVALYTAGDSTNFSSFQIIGCDDDNGVKQQGQASILYATGLVPGQRYYVVVDDYEGVNTGKFCIRVDAADSTMIAAAGSCERGQPGAALPEYEGWLSLTNNQGQLIANIRNNATLQRFIVYLPSTTVQTGAVRQAATGEYYLNRNYTILDTLKRSLNGYCDVQLFFKETELTALQAVNPAATLAGLSVTRSKNGLACNPGFTAGGAGNDSLLLQAASGIAGGVGWVTVSTNSLSNFYLHPGIRQLSKVYTFTGNGAWSNPANWANREIPPSQLPPNSAIEIKPVAGGQCVMDVPQRVPSGSSFRVMSGTNVVIPGSVIVQ